MYSRCTVQTCGLMVYGCVDRWFTDICITIDATRSEPVVDEGWNNGVCHTLNAMPVCVSIHISIRMSMTTHRPRAWKTRAIPPSTRTPVPTPSTTPRRHRRHLSAPRLLRPHRVCSFLGVAHLFWEHVVCGWGDGGAGWFFEPRNNLFRGPHSGERVHRHGRTLRYHLPRHPVLSARVPTKRTQAASTPGCML